MNLLKDPFEVVGTAMNGNLLIEAAARLQPDVVVTDLSMPGLNGLDVLERLKGSRADTKIIVLTMDADAELATYAIRKGASGFMTKVSAIDELVTAINEVLQGRVYVTHAIPIGVSLPETVRTWK
jgi:DNA-binding NarL/FixJ family response regulator